MYCYDFSEQLALVSIRSNFDDEIELLGFINEKGEYVIEPIYEKASSFKNGFAVVKTYKGGWKFINKGGEDVFSRDYEDARNFSEGLAAVKNNGMYGFIDKTGDLISKPIYQEVGDFKEGLARVKIQEKWGHINKTGKEMIFPKFIICFPDLCVQYMALGFCPEKRVERCLHLQPNYHLQIGILRLQTGVLDFGSLPRAQRFRGQKQQYRPYSRV